MRKLARKAVRKPKPIPPQLLKAAIMAFGDENVAKEWWWSTHEFTLQMCPAKLALTPKGRKFIKNYLASVIDLNYGNFSGCSRKIHCLSGVVVGYDMTDTRRMTIDPPLTEAEFARFCAENPDWEVDRDPSGVIVMIRKRKCRDNYGDWLLAQRGTVSSDIDLDDDKPRS